MTGTSVFLCLSFPLVRRHFLKSYQKGDTAVISNTREDPALVLIVTTCKKWVQFAGQFPLVCRDSSVCLQGTVDGAQTGVLIFLREESRGIQITRSAWWAAFLSLSPRTFWVALTSPGFFLEMTGTLEHRPALVKSVLLSLTPTGFWYV